MSPEDPRHGQERGHVQHIRDREKPCAPCREAHRRAEIMRKLDPNPRMVDVTGSRRRIQALQALGYSRRRIANALGYTDEGALAYICKPASATVNRRTAEKIARVYDQLSMTLPTGPGVNRARTWAKRHGLHPPLAWNDIDDPAERPRKGSDHKRHCEVDEAVVIRVLSGEVLTCTKAEKDEVMRRWVAAGKSRRELSLRMGWQDSRYGRETPERDEGRVA